MRESAPIFQLLDLPKTGAAVSFVIAFIAVIVWFVATRTDWLTYE